MNENIGVVTGYDCDVFRCSVPNNGTIVKDMNVEVGYLCAVFRGVCEIDASFKVERGSAGAQYLQITDLRHEMFEVATLRDRCIKISSASVRST